MGSANFRAVAKKYNLGRWEGFTGFGQLCRKSGRALRVFEVSGFPCGTRLGGCDPSDRPSSSRRHIPAAGLQETGKESQRSEDIGDWGQWSTGLGFDGPTRKASPAPWAGACGPNNCNLQPLTGECKGVS